MRALHDEGRQVRLRPAANHTSRLQSGGSQEAEGMRYRHPLCWIAVAAALPLTAAFADGFKLKLVPTGFTAKVGGYMPQRITLSADKPAELKKAPEMTAPIYGQLKLGAEAPYLIALDEPEGKDSKFYV